MNDFISPIFMGTLFGILSCLSERTKVDCRITIEMHTHIGNRALTWAEPGPWCLGPSPGLPATGLGTGPDLAWDRAQGFGYPVFIGGRRLWSRTGLTHECFMWCLIALLVVDRHLPRAHRLHRALHAWLRGTLGPWNCKYRACLQTAQAD